MTNEELITLFMRQERINGEFNGQDWREVPHIKWICAAQKEFSEFLDECTEDWVWWKPSWSPVPEKQLEEFVDTIAFGISVVLHRYKTDDFVVTDFDHKIMNDVAFSETYNSDSEPLTKMVEAWNQMMACTEKRAFTIQLLRYIEAAKQYLGVTDQQIIDAFYAKHIKNSQRIKTGYMETGDKTGLE